MAVLHSILIKPFIVQTECCVKSFRYRLVSMLLVGISCLPCAAHDSEGDCGLPVADRPSATQYAERPTLALRLNLLRWATFTPDLGIEWCFARQWALNTSYTWGDYCWQHNDRHWALSEFTAELRHYATEKGKGYMGFFFVKGQFNYKLSTVGRQGDHLGIGLSAGYQLPLSRRFSLDLGAAAGWLRITDGERYRREGYINVWRKDFTKSCFAPLSLRATLSYALFHNKVNKTKGGRP